MTAPTREEFASWREHPVTAWVRKGLVSAADLQKQAWIGASWDTGSADPAMLAELRTRADAYLVLEGTRRADGSIDDGYDALCAMNGDEPVAD